MKKYLLLGIFLMAIFACFGFVSKEHNFPKVKMERLEPIIAESINENGYSECRLRYIDPTGGGCCKKVYYWYHYDTNSWGGKCKVIFTCNCN